MITREALIEYRKRLNGRIYYAEPSDFLVVEGPDESTYRVTETNDDEFLALVKRSEKEDRNLFLVEDRLFDPYPDEGSIY